MTRAYWLAVAGIAALAACSPPDQGPRWRAAGATTPRAGGTLRLAVKDGITTLDPSIAYDEPSLEAILPLFDTLLDYPPDSTALVPRLAERWEVSPDGSAYHFWLRPGLVYADGSPIVARDFQASLDHALSTADSPFGPLLAEIVGAPEVLAGKAAHAGGIELVGERELVFHLVHPSAAFPYVLAMSFAAPQPSTYLARAGDERRDTPLASGPYTVERWDEGEQLVLVRNPHYFDPSRARIDRIELHEHIAPEAQILMLERGELDAADHLTNPDLLWVRAQPAWAPYLHASAQLGVYGVRMNVRIAPFTDRRVRQALNYALDKAHTIKLLAGTAIAAHGMLPPGMLGRDDTLAPYPHDPAKARALLAEAGFPAGLDLTLVTLADEEAEKLAVSMQADFAEVGVRLTIQTVSLATAGTALGAEDGPPLAYASWVADYPDPSGFFDAQVHSRAISSRDSTNFAFYANPSVDALLDAARAETDPEKRAASYQRVERTLYDDAPWIWNYHQELVEVVQPYVRDYVPHPVRGRDYRSAWLDLAADGAPVPW